jgi:hypothetical protein
MIMITRRRRARTSTGQGIRVKTIFFGHYREPERLELRT